MKQIIGRSGGELCYDAYLELYVPDRQREEKNSETFQAGTEIVVVVVTPGCHPRKKHNNVIMRKGNITERSPIPS